MGICVWCAENKPDVRLQPTYDGVKEYVCSDCYHKWLQQEKKEMLQTNVKHLQDENKKLKKILTEIRNSLVLHSGRTCSESREVLEAEVARIKEVLKEGS